MAVSPRADLFLGALYFGNRRRRRSGLMMFSGFICLGLGFVGLALAPSVSLVMAAASVSGFSGPMNELTFSDLLQSRFPIGDIARVFRLRMALETAVMLVLMLLAPAMFRAWTARPVIGLCGALWIALGAAGLLWQEKHL